MECVSITLLSFMNAKLNQQRFWPYQGNRFVKCSLHHTYPWPAVGGDKSQSQPGPEWIVGNYYS